MTVHFLSVRGLQKRGVLDDVNFDVERGECVVVCGPAGAGKTALLSAVAGVESVSAGTIELDGERVVGPAADRPFIPSRAALFEWMSVAENIDVQRVGAPHGEEGRGWLERFGLGSLAGRLPHELDRTEVQAAALVRAIALAPRALFIDESPEPRRGFRSQEWWRLIDDVRAYEPELTMMLAARDAAAVPGRVDRVLTLTDGTIQVARPSHAGA